MSGRGIHETAREAEDLGGRLGTSSRGARARTRAGGGLTKRRCCSLPRVGNSRYSRTLTHEPRSCPREERSSILRQPLLGPRNLLAKRTCVSWRFVAALSSPKVILEPRRDIRGRLVSRGGVASSPSMQGMACVPGAGGVPGFASNSSSPAV